MREITTHKGDPVNDAIKIHVAEDVYSRGDRMTVYEVDLPVQVVRLPFRSRSHRAGADAFTEEVLLAIVVDRLRCRMEAAPCEALADAEESAWMALVGLKELEREASRT